MKFRSLYIAAFATLLLAVYAGVASAGNIYYEDALSGDTDKIHAVDCSLSSAPTTFATLAGDPGASKAAALASDGTYVYYYNFTSGDSTHPYISRKPITGGGAAVRITGGSSSTIGVNDFILTMVGSDLYAQHSGTMYKIPNAASVTAKVNTDPRPDAADVTGSSPGGGTPAVVYSTYGSGGFYWLKGPSDSSPWVLTGTPSSFATPSATYAPSSVAGAPQPNSYIAFAGNSTTLYAPVFGGLGSYIATYTLASSTWNNTAMRFPNSPANDGAGTSSPSTNGTAPQSLMSTSDGSIFYLTTNTGSSNQNGLLYGYSSRSQTFALLKDLGTTSTIRRGAAIDPSCSFDATKVIPTLKTWETADKPTITPSATFGVTEGTAYTVTSGAWTESTGVNTYAYEWQGSATSSCSSAYSAVSGGNTASYTPVSADAGKCLRVKITPTSADGVVGVPVYVGGVLVAAGPPSNSVAPVVSLSGCTATITSNGTWSGSPTYMYSWKYYTSLANANADTSGMSGSSSSTTWTLQSTQNDKYVRGFVRAQNGVGVTTVGSNAVGPISGCTGGGGGGPANVALVQPAITQSGCALSVSNGTWMGAVSVYSYTWARFDGAVGGSATRITGATSNAYTATSADVGKYVTASVVVNGSGGMGSASATRVLIGSECGAGSTATETTTTTTSTSKPAPGPALKVADIPAEISLDLGSSMSADGTIPPDQPITAEVPCNAPAGELLDRCTVNVTAPEYVLLGQGDGIRIRSEKVVSIGKATVKAKAGKKTIVVKVKINGKGRKALQRNLKITATVGLTAVTVSNLKSTGEANTTMRLPTQLISPASGIFDSNSVSLNKAGIAFVNRLAALLPKTPKEMTFIGFADNTGVPGDNRWLGDRRAKAVRDALEAKGVTAAKSSIETKAARSPRADNSKAAGRERNRRVSIRITY